MLGRDAIEIHSRSELEAMRASGRILADAIASARAEVAPGVSTAHIDEVFAAAIAAAGATSSFLNYGGEPDGTGAFPARICASVNDQVVHGIPSYKVVLAEGDLLSIDAGCILEGWHADSAITVHVGQAPSMDEVDLIAATETSMWAGIAAAAAASRVGDISWAVEMSVRSSERSDGRRYGLVSGYGGHGIGSEMHMAPFIPNAGRRGKGPRLGPGMCLAIEPMLTLGRPQVEESEDGWTVVTRDGSRAAHTEHSVAITDDGICVLTASDGGAAGLAGYGIAPIDLG
ncbi:MAG: type I methionyl aminopeptidase [Nakamurella sp.]